VAVTEHRGLTWSNNGLEPTGRSCSPHLERCPVSAHKARSRQWRERIALLTVHRPRLEYEPVCLVDLGITSCVVRVMGFCRLCLTVLMNEVIIGV
jgi:hypothetical protein